MFHGIDRFIDNFLYDFTHEIHEKITTPKRPTNPTNTRGIIKINVVRSLISVYATLLPKSTKLFMPSGCVTSLTQVLLSALLFPSDPEGNFNSTRVVELSTETL